MASNSTMTQSTSGKWQPPRAFATVWVFSFIELAVFMRVSGSQTSAMAEATNSIKTAIYTSVNSKEAELMVTESICGLTVSLTRASGTRAANTVMGCGEARKATPTSVSGKTALHMDSVSKSLLMGTNMRASGVTLSSMGRARNNFITGTSILAITEMESLMALENTSGLIKGTSKAPS